MPVPTLGRFVKPDNVITHFHFREGDRVADFGAGSGFFLKSLSQVVGEAGAVYACEIQKGLVDKIGDIKLEQQLSNVMPLWCDLEKLGGTPIAEGELDGGIMVNTLFSLEDKATALQEIARTLRSGAKFFVIDWSESFGGMGPTPEDVVTRDAATELVQAAGMTFQRSFDAGDHHYGLAFRKG